MMQGTGYLKTLNGAIEKFGVPAQLDKENIERYIHAPKNTNPLIADMINTFDGCIEIAIKKNKDYSGSEANNPFANFEGSKLVGVSPEQGILVRMLDKIKRVSNLLKQEAAVKDESMEDTLNDIINYAAILKSYRKHNTQKENGISEK